MLLTLMAHLGHGTAPAAPGPIELPRGLALRICRPGDIPALGRLYYEAYPPGVAGASVEEAVADIQASFDGEYGELWVEASPVVLRGDDPVAALLTVHQAPWDDVPDCPFVIELFTAPTHRRAGLGRALVAHTKGVVSRSTQTAVALRVDADNAAALALYRQVGFSLVDAGTPPT